MDRSYDRSTAELLAARAVLAASALPPTSQQGHAYSGPFGLRFCSARRAWPLLSCSKTTTHSDKTGRGSGLRQPVQPVLGRVQSAQAPGNIAPLLEYYCRGREAGSSEFRPLDERTMANVRKDRRRRCPSLRSRAARVVRGRSQARCSGTGSLRVRGQTKGHLQLSVKGRPCESSAPEGPPGPARTGVCRCQGTVKAAATLEAGLAQPRLFSGVCHNGRDGPHGTR